MSVPGAMRVWINGHQDVTGVDRRHVRGDEGDRALRRRAFRAIDPDEIGRDDGSRLTVHLHREIARPEVFDRLVLRIHCGDVQGDQIDPGAKALRRALFGMARAYHGRQKQRQDERALSRHLQLRRG